MPLLQAHEEGRGGEVEGGIKIEGNGSQLGVILPLR